MKTFRKRILRSPQAANVTFAPQQRQKQDDGDEMYQTEFPGLERNPSNSAASNSSRSGIDHHTWDEERQKSLPAGDLHESCISSNHDQDTPLYKVGGDSDDSDDNEHLFYESSSRLVSFGPSEGYSSIDNYHDTNDEFGSDDEEDDDLSYDDLEEEKQEFEFSDSMLHDLRTEDSLFYQNKKGVSYRDRDHLGIMLQMYGSVWKGVFPYCVFNLLWCYTIDYLNDNGIMDLTIPSSGHSFMSILVAFLVVARVQITYGRFMEARGYLGGIFKNFRELMHTVATLTDNSTSEAARKWRQDVALCILATLRVTVAALEFSSAEEDPYNTVPEECLPQDIGKVREFLSRQAHFKRTGLDEALRAPLVFASSLRKILLEPKKKEFLVTELIVPEQLKLLSYVSGFTQSVHGLNKLITTPFSFPLVQMSRTILFFWVFTLPMALMTDKDERWQISIIVFFVTYGFLGLEYVSIELDDPFGPDPNDFNGLAMAQAVYEDMYLILYRTDGVQYAEELRKKITQQTPAKLAKAQGTPTRHEVNNSRFF